jgi:DNA-binding MarR family transcriptional regulator
MTPILDSDPNSGVPWMRFEGVAMSTGLAIRRFYDERLAGLGVNLPEAMLLAFVAEFGPLNQARIAQGLDSGRVTTALRIDALLRRGLVQRTLDPKDRRAWRVSTTRAGRTMVVEINRIDEEVRTLLRQGTTRAERRIFAQLARRVRATIDAERAHGDSADASPASSG